MLEVDLLHGWVDSCRGSTSIAIGGGHRKPVHDFAVSELVIYPTNNPDDRRQVFLSFDKRGNEYEDSRSARSSSVEQPAGGTSGDAGGGVIGV